MRLRFNILRIEIQLAALLAGELSLLNPATILILFYLPGYMLFLWFIDGGVYFKPIAYFVAFLVLVVTVRRFVAGSDLPAADRPITLEVEAIPSLRDFLRKAVSRVGRVAPRCMSVGLSPAPWHEFGVDLSRFRYGELAFPLPVCCLWAWSVSEFEVYVARMAVVRRGPRWLFTAVWWAIKRLEAEQYQAQIHGADHWILRVRRRALQLYVDTLNEWRFLTDLEADVKVAKVLGGSPVASLAYRSELANVLAPAFITTVVEPALSVRALVPVAEFYSAYAAMADPYWRESISEALKEADRSPESPTSALMVRLAVLSTISDGVTVHDPRPAASLFDDLRALERQAAASEFGVEQVKPARQVAPEEVAQLVVIPQIQREVERNRRILEGRTRFDIPELLRRKTEVAKVYKADAGFVLTPVEKELRVVHFLSAFLALDLLNEQWVPHYDVSEGLRLRLGSRELQPFTLVERLDSADISVGEFEEAVR